MPRLGIIVASTREGRVGLAVAEWFLAIAQQHAKFEAQLIDLKDIDLPLLDEPNHPRLRKYVRPRTQEWSEIVAALHAFVLVTPEYNFSSPPALVNALDHLYAEWHYKAAAFVSYGGISGGLRSVQMTKQVLSALKMVPIVEAVTISFVARLVGPDGTFAGEAVHEKAARTLLDELFRWDSALAQLRAGG